MSELRLAEVQYAAVNVMTRGNIAGQPNAALGGSAYKGEGVRVADALHIDKSLLDLACEYGVNKVHKQPWQSFGLAIFAGAFIALAFVFYITVTTDAGEASWGLVRLMGGVAFSLGLIFVVVLGGELFTSTVLSTVAWAKGRVTTQALLVCWGRVYLGNFVGAILMLGLVIMGGLHQLDAGLWGLNVLNVAQHKIHHDWSQAFALGILCNLLVCLGVWMTFACKDPLAKAVILILPVAMFVSSGFEHSIANLFMVPLGISIHSLLAEGWITANGALSPSLVSSFSDLTWSNFIRHNLIPVTMGNIVGGGIFVGLGYFCIERNTNAEANSANSSESACIVYPLSQYRPVSAQMRQKLAGVQNRQDDSFAEPTASITEQQSEPVTSLQFILSKKQEVS